MTGPGLGRLATILALAFLATPIAPAMDDGPDPDRRRREDATIAAADDAVVRAEARAEAAYAAMRLDLPPRLRTRLWWTATGERDRARAREAAVRARTLAEAGFGDLLANTDPARDRLEARTRLATAIASALEDRLSPDSSVPWWDRLGRLHREVGALASRTSELDGPTLLLLAAAALAADDAAAAKDLLLRVRSVPAGVDAWEYALLEETATRGSLRPEDRLAAVDVIRGTAASNADRLLLAAIELQSLRDRGEPDDRALDRAVRTLLPARGLDATDRVRLVRGLAEIADDFVSAATPVESLPPITALARLVDRDTGRRTPTPTRRESETWLARATTSSSPDVRAEAWLEIAPTRLRGGDADGALEALLAAIEAAPRHPRANAAADLAVRLADRLGDVRVADTVDSVLERMPEHPDRHRWGLLVGDRLLAAGRTQEAREAWAAIPRRSSSGPDALLRLWRLDLAGLDREDATRLIEDLDEILASLDDDPDDPRRVESDLLRIHALLALDRVTSAGELAARFVEVARVPEVLRGDLAAVALRALAAAGRDDEVARLRRNLSDVDPELAGRLASGKLQQRHEAVMEAVDRDDRQAFRRLADAALAESIPDPASARSRAASRPEDALRLAWLLAAAGRIAEASPLVEAVRTEHPDALEPMYLDAVLGGGRLAGTRSARGLPDAEDAAAAIRLLTRIQAGSDRGSTWWWRCELEKLEILAALERDLPRITARLARLSEEFRTLGGPAFDRRVRALQAAIRSNRIRE